MTQAPQPHSPIASMTHMGDVLVVALQGHLSVEAATALRTAVMKLIDLHRPARVILNLSEVSYMGSAMLGVLIEFHRRMPKPGYAALTHVQPQIQAMLEITHLQSILRIAATDADAMGLPGGPHP